MNREDFTEFHRLLAMLKYDLAMDFQCPNLSQETRRRIEMQIDAIDTLMPVCRFENNKMYIGSDRYVIKKG